MTNNERELFESEFEMSDEIVYDAEFNRYFNKFTGKNSIKITQQWHGWQARATLRAEPVAWVVGEKAIYKGETHTVNDVDYGYGYLALGGTRYITPNHEENNCISAPMDECTHAPNTVPVEKYNKLLDALIDCVMSLKGYRREFNDNQPCDAEVKGEKAIAEAESPQPPEAERK